MVHYDKCPLCLSGKLEKYLKVRDHFLSKEDFDLFRCSSCGFIITQDHPDGDAMGPYYESEDYLSHNEPETGFVNNLYNLSRNFMLKMKWRMVMRSTGLKKGTILDIGSGSGYFASFIRDKGWDVKGIEINRMIREISSSRFGLDILPPESLNELPSSSFDCITLWHVLEHFHEPDQYASQIRRILKPKGVCIVALPNCDSFDAGHYHENWAAWDVPRHISHFNPSTFSFFAEATHFTVTKTKALLFDVFYISILSEKYKTSKPGFITGMIKGVWFTFLSLFIKGRNSSVIYFLKKKNCTNWQ